MNPLKPTIIQSTLIWEDQPKNLKMFDELLANIDLPSDFIVLPEMFNTAFSMNRSLAETMNGETMEWMKSRAEKLNTPICGSLMIVEDEAYYNRFVWVNPNGTSQYYNKRHLFRMTNEQECFSPGNSNIIITVDGWKLFPVICYDLRFPVWLRRTPDFEYDVLLIVANWPEKRLSHWRTLLQARAIENQCYVLAVNRIGEDGNGFNYSGSSGLIDMQGEWLAEYKQTTAVAQVVLNHEPMETWRKNFPAAIDADRFTLA